MTRGRAGKQSSRLNLSAMHASLTTPSLQRKSSKLLLPGVMAWVCCFVGCWVLELNAQQRCLISRLAEHTPGHGSQVLQRIVGFHTWRWRARAN
eukprot:335320-Amphidinium_carterae.3